MKIFKSILMEADTGDGTGSNPPATPPPAAQTVASGKTEREVDLEKQLAAADAAAKKAQTEAAEWQDKFQTLLHAQQTAPAPTPTAPKRSNHSILPTLLHPHE